MGMTGQGGQAEDAYWTKRSQVERRVSASGQAPFLMCCNKEILYHGFLCFSSIAVTVTQATVLNFFIIAFFRGASHQIATYFWFLGDLFIVCFFAISFTTAYRYIHLRRKLEDSRLYTEPQIQQKIQRSIYKHVMWLSPRHCGTLPFSFITWFVYSSVLVAKLCLILSSGIPTELVQSNMKNNTSASINDMHDPIHGLDSNLLKVAVGLSALVFIIMLQAHHNHDPDSPHSGYIAGVCHNIAVEVFDSVTLLSLLFVQDRKGNFIEIWNYFKHGIIVLSSINLILPTLTLYGLSLSGFGRHLNRVIHIKVLSQLLQLFVINIPFLGVRIYLWAWMKYDLSLFVVKNLCYIFMLMHSLYPGMVYVLTGKPCGHLVPFSNDKKKSIEVVDGGANQANSPTSSNEIELVPMQLQSPATSEQPRNLNRVSKQAYESGDESTP